ncbi:complement C1q domain-containing protein [Flavobacterium wongokense]|uniref:complement C1q domain-containing protein n=1 Tax=Flavobacterium wongokense TaxID=2910674 RepID=UPI001F26F56F|nr:complement C1q domain-containing protein [Flavobacterium sp. WG47]MCF6131276.1 complement C1q domain-containing protein [Flavobacterium sp. WG47]
MMKSILFAFILLSFTGVAQVGIGTSNPTATLDVNGAMRVRSTATNSRETSAKDSILVSDRDGNIQRISSKMVIESRLKTFIKGGFSASADQSLTVSSGTVKVPFNYEDMDENNEFDTSTNTFTAKADGIYAINVQIKSNASSVATNFGVSILKNETVIARCGYSNIGVTIAFVTINVTPPVRVVQTLVKLSLGDTITFNIYTDLINVGLLSNKTDSFFTIQQVR